MEFRQQSYLIETTREFEQELKEIYEYISYKLCAYKAAERLLASIEKNISILARNPRFYMKIGKMNRENFYYRRIIVNNYIILYTIDEKHKKVYISDIFNGRQNYFKFLN